ncbi:MAG: transketolase [Microgenomates group bacterium]
MPSKNNANISIDELKSLSTQVRRDTIKMIFEAGSGHPAGSLSSVEIFVSLYFGILEKSDRFFLSNGHVCPSWYSTMMQAGLIEKDLLSTYAKIGSPLQGHPERARLSVVENTSGPLGLGVAQAVGYAKALKIDGKDGRVYALSSDAEHEEGNHWEAVLLASQFKLDNLILFVDRNRIQIETMTAQIAPLGSLTEKYSAFGWNTLEVNGHNFEEIFASVDSAKENLKSPTVIVANTVAGKGVSFMQSDPAWHAKAPTEEEFKLAMEELK